MVIFFLSEKFPEKDRNISGWALYGYGEKNYWAGHRALDRLSFF